MSSQGPLTAWLLSATPQALNRATTHPFLSAAGKGTLPKSTLSQWLSQDRLYAQSYIRFIGLLLSKIRLSADIAERGVPSEQAAVDALIDALVNIRRELRFFESAALEYGIDLTAISPEDEFAAVSGSGLGSITTSAGISTTGSGSCPGSAGTTCEKSLSAAVAGGAPGGNAHGRHELCSSQGECQVQSGEDICDPSAAQQQSGAGALGRSGPVYFAATRITHAYIDMFMSAGSPGVSVLEGLAVLWATEVCYLRSWRYAASFLEGRNEDPKNDTDGGALREKFIPNWSSAEFEGFVNCIGNVLDEMAGQIKGVDEAEAMRGRCLEWWKQVVWLEERFWPSME